MSQHCAALPYLVKPTARALFKQQPEDFVVEEQFDVTLSGKGEHLWLEIEKRNWATPQIVAMLAKALGADRRDVSYSGLKDKRAVTRQWFSVQLPGREPDADWQQQLPEGVRVVREGRHDRKLRRGSHQGNAFTIVLRQVSDIATVEARLQRLTTEAVPNYFGHQRFGFDDSNLVSVADMLGGGRFPHWREGLVLSAARSALFNLMVAARVENYPWPSLLDGDVMQLSGSRSFFVAETIDDVLRQRFADGDIEPTAALWGRREPVSQGWMGAQEREIAAAHPQWCQVVEKAGMEQERRPLALRPAGLEWQWQDRDLTIRFSLPRGAFATTVLRELVESESGTDGDEDPSE